MKRALCFSLLAVALLLPASVFAETHVLTRQEDGVRLSAPLATTPSFDGRFTLSSTKLSMCVASDSARYRMDLTPAEGVDLLGDNELDLRSLLTPALFKANAALLAPEKGFDVTDPLAVERGARRAADVSVRDELARLRLQVFAADGGSCGAAVDAGSPRRVTAAAESCSGGCNCTDCGCSGSFGCCLGGCLACWDVLDESGACGMI